VNVNSLLNFLDAIRQHSRGTRLFYAASSRIFGDPPSSPQTEATPIAPNCPYGISKAAGLGLCRLYRKEFGVFASVGILYNHESSRRSPSFVTRRLVRDAIAVKRGSRNRIEIGDSQAVVDWGYAPDFVDAFRRIMDLSEPDDFIIATGTPHTVAELVAEVLKAVELNSDVPVIEGRSGVKARRPPYPIVGDSRKLRAATGWRPTRSLAEIVRIMVNEELSHDAAPH
jgi:GDPmannose 4,6-dehydratase